MKLRTFEFFSKSANNLNKYTGEAANKYLSRSLAEWNVKFSYVLQRLNSTCNMHAQSGVIRIVSVCLAFLLARIIVFFSVMITSSTLDSTGNKILCLI